MAKKQKTIRQLIKIADKWFSLFIRLKAATDTGYVQCITCGKIKHYKNHMHCGHFIVRTWMKTRYHPLNAAVQCNYCNTWLGGCPENYYPYLLDKIGQEGIDHLKRVSREPPNSLTRDELEKIIELCKRGVKILKKEKGL